MEKVPALNGIDFSPEINMVRYAQKIRQYPILEQDEEYRLAVRYQQTKNPEIAKRNSGFLKALYQSTINTLVTHKSKFAH